MNINTLTYAQQLDQEDTLQNYRSLFDIPKVNGKPSIYFCGNSLGAKPKKVDELVQQELGNWSNLGVEGHFHAKNPWVEYHKILTPTLSKIVGAKPLEVVAMNSLTVNLHLLMVSFYQPTKERYKILMEGGAFPSDQYAIASQVQFHGFNPKDAIIEIFPREDEHHLRKEDIEKVIRENGDDLALVLMSGVQYYSGQVFPMEFITQIAHEVGAFAGFDLAHAVGNIPLNLHDWDVDFACWCSYKYLNSSPGGISGIFIHEKFAKDNTLPRFTGWWGHNEEERFLMEKEFKPMVGAEGWQLSNGPILILAAHKASLDIFEKVGMDALFAKSRKLTQYLYDLIQLFNQEQNQIHIEVITPTNLEERGCQLSLVFSEKGKEVFDQISAAGVIGDWREPDVIRLAPVPLYNSFEDIFRFYKILKDIVLALN